MSIQTSVTVPSVAVAGQPYDSSHSVLSGMFSTRKLVSVVIGASDSQVYTITINGVACSFTAGTSTTTALIAAGLVSAINGSSQAPYVTASGTNTPILIESDVDADFTYSDSAGTGTLTETVLVAHGQSAPAGVLLVIDERAARGVADFAVRLPRATGDVTSVSRFGVSAKTRASESASYTSQMVDCISDGRVWVPVEEAVTAGDAAFVRFAAGAGGTQLGAFRKSADSASAVALPNAKYLTDGSAGGLAVVQFDME